MYLHKQVQQQEVSRQTIIKCIMSNYQACCCRCNICIRRALDSNSSRDACYRHTVWVIYYFGLCPSTEIIKTMDHGPQFERSSTEGPNRASPFRIFCTWGRKQNQFRRRTDFNNLGRWRSTKQRTGVGILTVVTMKSSRHVFWAWRRVVGYKFTDVSEKHTS
jgi:hypothetical protein